MTANFSSTQGIARTLGTSHKKVRTAVRKLTEQGLITAEPHNKGTRFGITQKGKRYLLFCSEGYDDFEGILEMVQQQTMLQVLTIVRAISMA